MTGGQAAVSVVSTSISTGLGMPDTGWSGAVWSLAGQPNGDRVLPWMCPSCWVFFLHLEQCPYVGSLVFGWLDGGIP